MPLVSKTFSQIITFTRASSATYFDSAGVLQTATTDVPRFDYDPSTLAARGFLIEEARTNLCLQSEDWSSATWSKPGSTITANATTAPTGTTVADKLVEDTSTGTHGATQTISLGGSVDNSAYVISVFAKASERTRFQLFDNAQTSSGITAFDLSNGTVISGTGTITAVGNNWYRCSVFPLKSTSITSTLTIRLISTGTTTSYTGDGTSGLFLWGAQLEAGAFPTSYIPTTTTAVTRAADVASVNTLSPWFNAVASTVYFEGTVATVSDAQTPYFWSISDNTKAFGAREQIAYARNASSVQTIGLVATGGVTNASVASSNTTVAANTIFKSAASYATNDVKVCVNGLTPATTTSATLPSGLNSLKLGAPGWNAALVANAFYIRRLTYYPRALSAAELQSITT